MMTRQFFLAWISPVIHVVLSLTCYAFNSWQSIKTKLVHNSERKSLGHSRDKLLFLKKIKINTYVFNCTFNQLIKKIISLKLLNHFKTFTLWHHLVWSNTIRTLCKAIDLSSCSYFGLVIFYDYHLRREFITRSGRHRRMKPACHFQGHLFFFFSVTSDSPNNKTTH